MKETLQEYCDSRGVCMRIDRENGVIHGVKILGLRSRNGRDYLPEALVQAARLYEDAKVNVNHPKGNPTAPRDYQDRIGTIRNVEARPGEGLFGNFYFNPKHALGEQLVWDAEHAPENVGFSHNVEARTSRRGERVLVEAITRVQSVDLVADPASTQGLFEAAEDGEAAARKGMPQSLTLEQIKRDYPDLVEAIRNETLAERRELESEIQRLTGLNEAHRKQDAARRLLCRFKLPLPESENSRDNIIVSEQFMNLLLAAKDERAMQELVEERARLVGSGGFLQTSGKPCSRDQFAGASTGACDAESFVKAIT
ncbi:MAG: hypothetical protein ACWGMZ_00325 [Thermoguttaceae bacterium]